MNRIHLLCFLALIVLVLNSCSSLGVYSPKREVVSNKNFTPSWIKNLDPAYETGNLPIALGSPLIHDGIVYIGHNKGFMQAYELKNGMLVWSEADDSTFHAPPVAYKDQVIYGTVQGRVLSRDLKTGKIKYSVDLGASVESKGVIYRGRILFHLRNHQIFCLDVETGKILWGHKRSISSLTTLQRSSTPVVYKDRVLVGTADGNLVALTLDEGVLLYETKLSSASKFVDVDNSVLVLNDKVYIGAASGALSILDPNTGKILRKSDFIASRAPLEISDEPNNPHLLFGTPTGDLVLSDKNLNVLKTVTISKGVITSIVSYKNGLAVSTTAGEILFVDLKTLTVIERFDLGHSYSAVFGDLESKDKSLAVLSSRNRLFLFH